MLDQLQFAFGITGPILLLLLIGWSARSLGWVNDTFVSQSNTMVFNVAMPVMLFFAMSGGSFDQTLNLKLTIVGAAGTIALVGLLLIVGKVLPLDQRGVFVQGSYRGNLAILGVALCVATYGEGVLPIVALYIGVVTTVYNILAIWVLNSSGALTKIAKNPILIGIVAGAIASVIQLPMPVFIESTGRYLAQMTLPLALLCIGATLDFGSLRTHGKSISLAVIFKLLISPVLLVGSGYVAGLAPKELGILFFMSASPTATASYIMARQMTSHGPLAAEIVAVTTALGVLSYTFGLALLRSLGLV
ncbi:MAG: AEC family transporter [Granulosicoccus sp.]